MSDNYTTTTGKRPVLVTRKKAGFKKNKSAKSAQKKPVKNANKISSMQRVASDTIESARAEIEGGFCIYTFNRHLPKTQPNYRMSFYEKNIDSIPLKLPQWRDTSIYMTTCMYQLAMAEFEKNTNKQLIPFTFLLSQDLVRRSIDTEASEASYIRKRLSDSLRRSLNRDRGDTVDFWFTQEFAKKNNEGHPHIQGSILLYPKELKKARDAFYKLNKVDSDGDTDKDRWLRFGVEKRKSLIAERGQLATDLNWASYNTKELGTGKLFFTRDRHNTAATQKLKANARRLYDELREIRGDSSNRLIEKLSENHYKCLKKALMLLLKSKS